MKKIFALFAFAIFGLSFSQTHFGVKAGYNLSNMKWKFDNYSDYNFGSKSFFYIGFMAEHNIMPNLSLQGELIFTELGGKSVEELTEILGTEIVNMGTATTKWTNTQIQLPISVKYYIVPNQFSLSGGFNFGFSISEKVKTNFIINGQNEGDPNLFKKVSIFPFIGTEYKISPNLFVDLRYNFGLFNIANSDSPETRIGFLQTGIGYTFK